MQVLFCLRFPYLPVGTRDTSFTSKGRAMCAHLGDLYTRDTRHLSIVLRPTA